MITTVRDEVARDFYTADYYLATDGKRSYKVHQQLIDRRCADRVRKVKKSIKERRPVLEVGCGIENIASLEGIILLDFSDAVPGLLDNTFKEKFVFGTAYNLPFRDCSFEGVILIDVIEHLRAPEDAIREAHRVIKNNGVLYISTFNKSGIGVMIHGKGYMLEADKSHTWEPTIEDLNRITEDLHFSEVIFRTYSNMNSFPFIRKIINHELYIPFNLGSNIEMVAVK